MPSDEKRKRPEGMRPFAVNASGEIILDISQGFFCRVGYADGNGGVRLSSCNNNEEFANYRSLHDHVAHYHRKKKGESIKVQRKDGKPARVITIPAVAQPAQPTDTQPAHPAIIHPSIANHTIYVEEDGTSIKCEPGYESDV